MEDSVIKSLIQVLRTPGPIRSFVSYSTVDKELAGKIKHTLESYWNFNVFLAHDDLEPSAEWESEILRNLENAEVFIPLITENFHTSKWTDQESGIAFGKGKIFLPISLPTFLPYGFMNRYHAFKYDPENPSFEQIMRVVQILEDRHGFTQRTLNGALLGLANSSSYEMTRNLSKYLSSRFDGIRRGDFKKILIAEKNNSQVRDEAYKYPALKARLVNKYGKVPVGWLSQLIP